MSSTQCFTHEHDQCFGTEQHHGLCTPQQWLVLSLSILSKRNVNKVYKGHEKINNTKGTNTTLKSVIVSLMRR